MIPRIKAFTLLLSFMMVLGHLMIPHHHHENLAGIKKTDHEPVTHTHHHGSNHHHHDHEQPNSEDNESHDQNIPQHFHISTSYDFELLRVGQVEREISEPTQSITAVVDLFSWDADQFYELHTYPNIWPDKTATAQNKPGANGLRAPPSIA